MKKEKFVIIGAGPVGSILAAHLIQGGHDVTLVDIIRAHLDKMRTDGLVINGKTALTVPITKTFETVDDLVRTGQKFDYAFVCVKTPIIRIILGSLPRILTDGGTVISFQNGLDTGADMTEVLSPERILRGVVNYAGNMNGMGSASLTFFHPPNYMGAAIPGNESAEERAKVLAALMTEADLHTEFTAQIRKYVWAKVIRNAALMPISALTGMNMTQAMETEKSRRLVERLLTECIAVARAEGFEFDQAYYDESLTYLSNGGAHKPSMLYDVREGQITEIGFLNHKIAKYGEKHGVDVTYNRVIADLVMCIDELTKLGRQK